MRRIGNDESENLRIKHGRNIIHTHAEETAGEHQHLQENHTNPDCQSMNGGTLCRYDMRLRYNVDFVFA